MSVTYNLPNVGLKQKLGAIAYFMNNNLVDCILFTSPTSISPSTSSADIVEPNFPGYVAQHATATVVGAKSIATPTLSSTTVSFVCSSDATSISTIAGVAWQMTNLVDDTTDVLAIALMPGGPTNISKMGDSILVSLTLTDQRAPGQP